MSWRVRRLAAAARAARVRCVCSVAALGERARRLQAAGEVQRISRLARRILPQFFCTAARVVVC